MAKKSKEKEPQIPEEKEPQSKPKKKRGFLGWLMIVFMIFVVLVAAATGLVYWKRQNLTKVFLKFYAGKVSDVLIQHYQIEEDRQGKTDREILNEREKELADVREALLDAYCNNASDTGWYESLKSLDATLKDILRDQKVSSEEFGNFIKQVRQIAEKHRVRQTAYSVR